MMQEKNVFSLTVKLQGRFPRQTQQLIPTTTCWCHCKWPVKKLIPHHSPGASDTTSWLRWLVQSNHAVQEWGKWKLKWNAKKENNIWIGDEESEKKKSSVYIGKAPPVRWVPKRRMEAEPFGDARWVTCKADLMNSWRSAVVAVGYKPFSLLSVKQEKHCWIRLLDWFGWHMVVTPGDTWGFFPAKSKGQKYSVWDASWPWLLWKLALTFLLLLLLQICGCC